MNIRYSLAAVCAVIAAISALFAFGGIADRPWSDYAVGYGTAFLVFAVIHLALAVTSEDEIPAPPEVIEQSRKNAETKSSGERLLDVARQLEAMASELSYDTSPSESKRKHYMRECADRLKFLARELGVFDGLTAATIKNNLEASGSTYPGTARRMDGGGRFG